MSRSGDFKQNAQAFVLILQLGIAVMVPTFLCLAVGIWLDHRFGTIWWGVGLTALGIAAGALSAYKLARGQVGKNTRPIDEQYDLMQGWEELTDDPKKEEKKP